MECEDVAERLTDLLEGDLPEAEEAAALEHLATCASCEVVLAETRSVTELAQQHGGTDLSDEDKNRMLSSVIDSLGEEGVMG